MKQYVIFDIETTGMSPSHHQIIQIAAEKWEVNPETLEAAKVDSYNTYIKNHKHLNSTMRWEPGVKEAYDIHKIEPKTLAKEGIGCFEAIKGFFKFSKDCILVAHNAQFDIGFMHYALYCDSTTYHNKDYKIKDGLTPSVKKGACEKELLSNRYVDSVKISKMYNDFILDDINNFDSNGKKIKRKNSLGAFTKAVQLDYDPNKHHNAIYDVEITALAFFKALNELNKFFFDKGPKYLNDLGLDVKKSENAKVYNIFEAIEKSPTFGAFNSQKALSKKEKEDMFKKKVFTESLNDKLDTGYSALFYKNIWNEIKKDF